MLVPGGTKRKNKWINANYPTTKRFGSRREFLPPTFVDLPSDLTSIEVDQFFREQRLDQLVGKLRANILEIPDPADRDPSPDPTYDETGARTNSRETVSKRKMEEEFGRLNRFLAKRIPSYSPPSDLVRHGAKIVCKVAIPSSAVSVIVGPRGINHKKIQEDSKCRVEIRGKTSSAPLQSYEESQMDLHVHIEGETDQDVETCVESIGALLDPNSREYRAAKALGAETLAVMAGSTARCPICDALGHTANVCPDRSTQHEIPLVACSKCGGKGHIAADCIVGSTRDSNPPANIDTHTPLPTVMVPAKLIGSFIGQGGSNIKKLMIETGCNIQVDQAGLARGVSECPLMFHGPESAILKAIETCKLWIENMINKKSTGGMTASGGFTDSDAAAAAVQMAYMQQVYWQAWAAQNR